MAIQIFDYKDYKNYINDRLDEIDSGGRGSRAKLSKAVGCQSAYTAQVLRGSSHFSSEQGEEVNQFLGHTEEESNYFHLILQAGRAGTVKLKNRISKQIEYTLKSRLLVKNRLESSDTLSDHHQAIYYSSWHYGAIHALISIPGYQTPERIAEHLRINIKSAREAIEFLLKSRLIVRDNRDNFKIGRGQIHLGIDSPLISKHHLNWRMQSIKSIELNREESLHYSSVISISKKDEALIREKLLKNILDIKPIIKKSKEEELCGLCLDFFRI